MAEQTFAQPAAISFDYLTYAGYLFDPATLELYIHEETGWVKAASTCPAEPNSLLDPQRHTFTTYTCQTGQFALYGVKDRVTVYLAVVRR